MEAEERDRHAIENRIRDAKLPRVKTLEEFDFNQARQIPAAKIRELAEGDEFATYQIQVVSRGLKAARIVLRPRLSKRRARVELPE